VGLIVGLLTLPLAPVRGTAWLAERLQEQAEEELYDEGKIMRQFHELEMDRASGAVDEQTAEEVEQELFDRLMIGREIAAERGSLNG
jgi:hypothetical protein